MKSMMRPKVRFALILVLIIAGFLRLYHVTTLPPGLYPDEAMDGNSALDTLRTHDFKPFYIENNGREGLYIWIEALTMQATGIRDPWILRLPAAIAGILTVLGLYFLGKELFSARTGLLAAFFLATNFWHINFSRIGFRAILAPLLLTWALFLFLKSVRGFSEGKNVSSFLWALLGGVIYGLGFYTYIAYRITPILFLLLIPFFRKQRGFWTATFAFIAAAFITALPIGIYFLHNPADFSSRTSEISITSSPMPLHDFGINVLKTFGMFFVRGDENWRHNIAGAPELFFPVAILFAIGAIMWVIQILKKNNYRQDHRSKVIVTAWFTLALLPVAISNEGLPHALRSILMVIPVMFLAAIGAEYVWKHLEMHSWPLTRRLCAAVFLIAVAVYGYVSYFIVWGKNANVQGAFATNYVEIGNQLNALPITAEKYVIVRAGGVAVRGIPMPAQTVMFVTDTFDKEQQIKKHIHYILPGETKKIPPGVYTAVIE